MSDPFLFDTASPRYGLPLLFPGQSQKEVFVNEAHALTDALLHCAIEGEAAVPPSSPTDGEAGWSAPRRGVWAGQAGKLAPRQAGNWIFVRRDGLGLLDRSTGQERRFFGSWRFPDAPLEPIGGSVVDAEARQAIVEMIAALKDAGIYSGEP